MRTQTVRGWTLVLALCCAPLTIGRSQGRPPACASGATMTPDSLRAYARTLEPAAFEQVRRDSAMMVALVFDAACHLQHHALGRQSAEPSTVDVALARLLPATRVSPWTISGFVGVGFQPRAPIIAWAVLAPTDSAR